MAISSASAEPRTTGTGRGRTQTSNACGVCGQPARIRVRAVYVDMRRSTAEATFRSNSAGRGMVDLCMCHKHEVRPWVRMLRPRSM